MIQIVISSPEAVDRELQRIVALFEAGMELFHLRKSNASELELTQLLKEVPEDFREKIALHQHHRLAARFGIKRLHFPEKLRMATPVSQLESLKTQGHILSTSIHKRERFLQLSSCFSYALYGPVFPSISKPGYQPSTETPLQKLPESGCKKVAIGGIEENKIPLLREWGFDGYALLGAIWQENSKDGLKHFLQCRKTHEMIG
ncbi:thiamine phosphate synthase [Negadavirga shengliensis]|uniref:Thiamine phosphate synthase n=1 Tax=Negadavirga shengliensis TaxID=1389218 RepID=A0ABV9T6C3_9BACT